MNKEDLKNNKYLTFIKDVADNVSKYKLTQVSASLTYYILLCIGPFLMLLFYLIVNFIKAKPEIIYNILQRFMSDPEIIVDPLLFYLRTSQSGGLALISIIVTLYSASSASRNLIKAMGSILGSSEKEGIKNAILAIIFSIVFTAVLIISLVLILSTFIYGDPITVFIDFLFDINLKNFGLWNFITGYLPLIYMFFLVILVYQALNIRQEYINLSWDEQVLGAGFTTIGWIIASVIYSLYVNNFSRRNVIYGSLGNFMGLMLWIYILMIVLLLGTVIVKVYSSYKKNDSLSF